MKCNNPSPLYSLHKFKAKAEKVKDQMSVNNKATTKCRGVKKRTPFCKLTNDSVNSLT